jgi:hypothetical protein
MCTGYRQRKQNETVERSKQMGKNSYMIKYNEAVGGRLYSFVAGFFGVAD